MNNIFGAPAAAAPSVDPTEALVASLSARAATSVSEIKSAARKPSQYWLNIGVVVPGIGENGTDVFVTLPTGIALDDLKAIEVKGSNANWIQLQQGKNALLAMIQGQAAGLSPGERKAMPRLVCEVSRVNQPSQQADTSNALASAVTAAFG